MHASNQDNQDNGVDGSGWQEIVMRNNDQHMVSRRRFLKQAGAIAVASLPGSDRLVLANLTSAGQRIHRQRSSRTRRRSRKTPSICYLLGPCVLQDG